MKDEENRIKIAVEIDMSQLDLAIEKAQELVLLLEKANLQIRKLAEREITKI